MSEAKSWTSRKDKASGYHSNSSVHGNPVYHTCVTPGSMASSFSCKFPQLHVWMYLSPEQQTRTSTAPSDEAVRG